MTIKTAARIRSGDRSRARALAARGFQHQDPAAGRLDAWSRGIGLTTGALMFFTFIENMGRRGTVCQPIWA